MREEQDGMGSKWQNVDAGPRQVKDFNRAVSKLRGEGQAHDELTGVIGGKEHRSTYVAMMGTVRAEVAALEEAIGEAHGWKVTRANVRDIIAAYEAALPEARKSRPVEDSRRTPEEEAERVAAAAARDAEMRAAQEAHDAVLSQVMAKAPAGAKALIVAEYHEDDSDVMTDYFNSRVTRTVAIGFRTGSREDFRQLRAAAGQFAETAHLATGDVEHRENYSMGGGNYLSDHGSKRSGSGWVVKSADFPCKWVHLDEDAVPEQPAAAAPAGGSALQRSKQVDGDALGVIARAAVDGNALRFTERLDRATYTRAAEALAAIGGKWNRKAQAVLFPGDAAPLVASLLDSGRVVTAADEGWFPTPARIAAFIADLAGITEGMTVLEPSAGEGAIAAEAAARGAVVDCVELNAGRASGLLAAGFARMVTPADFLSMSPLPAYDRVLMNPPFAGKADIAHVRHAAGFLKPGGLLVAVMAAGVAFREDRATADFRELVTEAGGTIKPLPDGTFRESGTDVRTVLVTLPAAAERSPAYVGELAAAAV